MLFSEVEEFINNWYHGESKVFDVKYDFFEPDTIIVLRKDEDIFTVDIDKSTTKKYEYFSKDELIMKLRNGTLIYRHYSSVNTNYNTEKSKGCICGSHVIKDNEYMHDPDCPRYRGNF